LFFFFFSYKLGEQGGRTGLVVGGGLLVPVGLGKWQKKGIGGWRAMEGVNSDMIYLIHHKNLCKCHNVSPPSTTTKKKKG
jgi:hypothetical protein